MSTHRPWLALTLLTAIWSVSLNAQTPLAKSNSDLLQQLQAVHGLQPQQMDEIRSIFAKSPIIGQGNPAITQHPVTPEQCKAKLGAQAVTYVNPRFEHICGAPYMAPLYDPTRQHPEEASACIDQFEFPDIPCTYPVVWVKAQEAAQLCAAEGKRLCDANEWEDACQGRTEPPDYRFDLAEGVPPATAIQRIRQAHNTANSAGKRWSYGPSYEQGICATGSFKTLVVGPGGTLCRAISQSDLLMHRLTTHAAPR